MPKAAPPIVRLARDIARPDEGVWACLVENEHIRRWWYEKFPSDRAILLRDWHEAGCNQHLDNFSAHVEARPVNRCP